MKILEMVIEVVVLDLPVFKFFKNKSVEELKVKNLELKSQVLSLQTEIKNLKKELLRSQQQISDLGTAIKAIYELIQNYIKINSEF